MEALLGLPQLGQLEAVAGCLASQVIMAVFSLEVGLNLILLVTVFLPSMLPSVVLV